VPRGRPGKGGDSESITVAKIAFIGTVLAALITAVAGMFSALIKDKPPSAVATSPPGTVSGGDLPPSQSSTPTTSDDGTAMPASPDGTQVEFLYPQEDALISPHNDVTVTGTVTGLGSNTLWILSWHEDGGSFFLIPGAAGVSAVTTKDGPWSTTDQNVGNSSDKGRTIAYTAVGANSECNKTLSAMRDDDSFREPPKGCIILPGGQRSVRVK
jgi:hypothetical protein